MTSLIGHCLESHESGLRDADFAIHSSLFDASLFAFNSNLISVFRILISDAAVGDLEQQVPLPFNPYSLLELLSTRK